MAKYIKSDETINITAASDLAAGAVVTVGTKFGVAHAPIASGEYGAVSIKGTYEFDCTASIEQGADVYYISGNQVGASASGLTKIGTAATAGVSGGAILVIINE